MFREVMPNVFPTHDFRFHSSLVPAEINKSDFLLIGGGNIVDPKFLLGLDEIKIPYSFIGVGLTHPEQVPLLKGAEQVFVRDGRSYGFIKDLPNTYLLPDLAFSLTPSQVNGHRLLRAWFDNDKPTIGVFLIGNMKRGYQTHCLLTPLAAQQQLDLVSALDYGITMRLHASIFCTLGGIPFLDLTHHSKSRSYLETMGLGEWSIDYYELSIKVLEEKFSALSSRRSELRDQLLLSADQQKTKFREVVAHVRLP